MVRNPHQQLDVGRRFLVTTPITFKEKPNEHGTGFFYNSRGKTYLVTNKHVLKHDNYQPNNAQIYFRDYNDVSNTQRHSVEIMDDSEEPLWLGHPAANPDLVVLPLNQKLSGIDEENVVTGSLALSEENILPEDRRIRGGEDAHVIGYPEGFLDVHSYFPIIRDARVSTPYGVNFDNQPCFVTDARMRSGTSGSPVFLEPSARTMDSEGRFQIRGRDAYLLGVHSGNYYSLSGDTERVEEKYLDLNITWYAELIEQIVTYHDFLNGGELPKWFVELYSPYMDNEIHEEFFKDEALDETLSEQMLEEFLVATYRMYENGSYSADIDQFLEDLTNAS